MISYVIFNIINVITQTIKSIVTIKCNKYVAAVVNAVAYGLYTYIVVLTASNLDLWFKISVTAAANLVGVFVVKWVEEKKRKDKLWKVEATIKNDNIWPEDDDCIIDLRKTDIPFNYIDINKYIIINCYCATQKDSTIVKEILDKYNAKYFVSESKIL